MKMNANINEVAWSGLFKVAIVGATSLEGKELKDVLTERNFPSSDVKLLDDEEAQGQLEAVGDEPTFVQSVTPEHLEGMDFTFFACDPAYTLNTWQAARDKGSEIVDLSYALEAQAALRAPWVERELGREFRRQLESVPVVVAHPAAAVLALLLLRLQRAAKVRSANATVFEPASERGRRGMDELHDQTVNLLSFQQMPTEVFGTQIAFNIVPAYGEGKRPAIAEVQDRIVRHYKWIVNKEVPTPSVLLLQAPVFHAHTFSIYAEMEDAIAIGDLESALSGEHVQMMRGDENPSNVNVAGSSLVQVSVRADSTRKNGVWLWVAADNLRVTASLAVEAAEEMATMRPRGKVQ